MSRKKTIINFLISIFSQLIILILGFIVPWILMNNYGSNVNGLVGTINQIFTYMALFEAGISIATRNALFKPLNEDNHDEISIIMTSAKKYYSKVSLIYLLVVVILSFTIPLILKSNVDYWTICLYVMLEGLTNVITFYFVNKWSCFLVANGKAYIYTSINLLSKILCYAIKIILAYFSINIAYIQFGYFAVSLIQLIVFYLYMKRNYGWINYKTKITKKLPNRNYFIITEIAWTVFSSTDMIILSIFLSTSSASVYSVYNMIFVALTGIVNSIYFALNYNLGRTYAMDIEKYKLMHSIYHTFFLSLITLFMCVTYILIIPFIKLYTKNVDDVEYIYKWLPLLFGLIQILSWSRYIAGNLCSIAGYAKHISVISILEASLNISLSIIFVHLLGIYGVLIATLISVPLKVILLNYFAEKKILKRFGMKTILTIFINLLLFALTVIWVEFYPINIDNYFQFCLYGLIFLLIYFFIVSLANILVNNDILVLLINRVRKKNRL